MNILTGMAAAILALSTAAAVAQTPMPQRPYIGGYQTGPNSYGGTASGQQVAQPYIGGYQTGPGPYYGGNGSAQVQQPYIGGYGTSAAPVPSTATASTQK
jgi:hypothetical protein